MQSVSAAHAVGQRAAPAQRYGEHDGLAPGLPTATVVQVPVPLLQVLHPPAQLVSQQVRSAQLPVAHVVPTVHPCPRFDLQAPAASQVFTPLHSLLSSALLTCVHVPGVAPHV